MAIILDQNRWIISHLMYAGDAVLLACSGSELKGTVESSVQVCDH